jgi:hypothetical protein
MYGPAVIASNIFILRDVALGIGGFDGQLGIGSVFGSVEDNDLVARALGHRGLAGMMSIGVEY